MSNATNDQLTLCKQYSVDSERIPHHVAIIMDGNGRWAKQRFLPRNYGHKEGQKNVKRTLINCVKIGVKVLSVYVFSTENWKRPETEVRFLMSFLKKSIKSEINELIKEGVKLRFLGDLSLFDESMVAIIKDAEEQTALNTTIQLNVMLNYGGRREIVDAVQAFVNNGGDIQLLDEQDITKHLYSFECGDPDILIRTGGDVRISNFFLWQIAYSELFFLNCFWPDFSMDDLMTVIAQFQSRDRRFGGLNE